MNSCFTIGELSKHQNISRQTLIYYDKIGLFCPAYTDPGNGYRYYSPAQLDYLDTILILKKIGFSLDEIKEHMKHYTMERSIAALQKQLVVINRRIEELQMLKSRVKQRCTQMESCLCAQHEGEKVTLEQIERQYILLQPVPQPHTLEDVSLLQNSALFVLLRRSSRSISKAAPWSPMTVSVRAGIPRPSMHFSPLKKRSPPCRRSGSFRRGDAYAPTTWGIIFPLAKHTSASWTIAQKTTFTFSPIPTNLP